MAVIGIYGVMAFSVVHAPTKLAFGIGSALRNVVMAWCCATERPPGLGIVIGLAGALALTRVLQTLLFEVKATDPLTFTMVPVALMACALPAGCLRGVRRKVIDGGLRAE